MGIEDDGSVMHSHGFVRFCVFALLDGDHVTTLCDDNPVIDLPCDELD
jgi:hypothetical protein